MALKLSTLAIIMGAVVVAINLFGVVQPAKFAAAALKFPRSRITGYALTLFATGWFVWNVNRESLSDFESLKTFLFMLFVAVGIGTCLFVHDYLTVRGLAAMMLLLAKLMVDTARWSETEWRLVMAGWAYVLVIAGIWFTVSPWRCRDLIQWCNATPLRTRITSGIRLAFGVLVLVLGFMVF